MSTVSKVIYYALTVLALISCATSLAVGIQGDEASSIRYMVHACFCLLMSLWVKGDSEVDL